MRNSELSAECRVQSAELKVISCFAKNKLNILQKVDGGSYLSSKRGGPPFCLFIIKIKFQASKKLYVKIKLDGWWRVHDTNTWSVVES